MVINTSCKTIEANHSGHDWFEELIVFNLSSPRETCRGTRVGLLQQHCDSLIYYED